MKNAAPVHRGGVSFRAVCWCAAAGPYKHRRMGFDPPTVHLRKPRRGCRGSLEQPMEIQNFSGLAQVGRTDRQCELTNQLRLGVGVCPSRLVRLSPCTPFETADAPAGRIAVRTPASIRASRAALKLRPPTLDRSKSGGANGQTPTSELRLAPSPDSSSLISTVRNGLATLKALVDQHGALPRTAIVKTGRGWHLYFAMPARCERIPCSNGR